MSGFSEIMNTAQARLESLTALRKPLQPLEEILALAKNNQGLRTEEAASLLAWGKDPDCREIIHRAARKLRESLAPRKVEFIIPVYLTSFCQNECLYCGYRESNPMAERVRLGMEEFETEMDLILSWGYRQIELVLADDPDFGPREVARYVDLTRKKLQVAGGGAVALCSPVYEQDAYTRLSEAGIDWVVEWQETYHRPHFDRWHFPGSPKRQYEFRTDLWDRVIAGGISKISLGVLLGLYDWRYDILALVEHGNYLRRTYGVEPHALGIPRLKPARGVLASQKASRFAVSDDDFRFIVSLYRLAFPRSRLFFNTRERYDLNLSMVGGGDLFTVDCETLPGGYLRRDLPGQFSIHGYPSRHEVVRTLESLHLDTDYLAAETEPPAAAAPMAHERDMEFERWAEEHEAIRLHLDEWENVLSSLPGVLREEPQEPKTGLRSLRAIMEYFKTTVMEHCRKEESAFLPAASQGADASRSLQEFRDYHEHLAIDLDKFDRQISSYRLSGDAGALRLMGSRIVREMRRHLDTEDEFQKLQARASV